MKPNEGEGGYASIDPTRMPPRLESKTDASFGQRFSSPISDGITVAFLDVNGQAAGLWERRPKLKPGAVLRRLKLSSPNGANNV